MGRFDRTLLVSDFDNTLLYTDPSLRTGAPLPPMPERNLTALRRFMAEGGIFAVATGRAMTAFRRCAPLFPSNAPTIVGNGGAIYDYQADRYLESTVLPPEARGDIADVAARFPELSLELYHPGDLVQVKNPSAWNDQHAKLTGNAYQVVEDLGVEAVPDPLSKALLIGELPVLEEARAFLLAQGAEARCELIFSSDCLLEMTAKGANKGDMALKLKARFGCARLICVGDHKNDLPMLAAADRAFAPENAVEAVRESGAELLCHSRDGAIGDLIERLEREI